MTKNIIIAILAVAVLLLLINRPSAPTSETLMVSEQATETPATTPTIAPATPSKTSVIPKVVALPPYTVSYTDKGFTPAVLEVSRGTSVKFVNNSSKAMRIMSTDLVDRQPSNEINESKTVGKGAVYSLTLNTPFVYGYRNANYPSDIGTVVVK